MSILSQPAPPVNNSDNFTKSDGNHGGDLFGNIPEELKDYRQWVSWKRVPKTGGGFTKIPLNAKTGGNAATDTPDTFCPYHRAVESYSNSIGDGIGFVLTEHDAYCGIDLDHCRDPDTGHLTPGAADIVAQCDSYTEVTPSETGIRIWMKGKLAGTGGNDLKGFEIYDRGRFFTVTGEHIGGTPTTIEERQSIIDALYREHFPHKKLNGKPSSNGKASHFSDAERAAILAELHDALPFIPAVEYETWLHVGMGIHHVDRGEAGFALWDAWSQTCTEKYMSDACEGKWRSFKNDGGITHASIFALAMEHGWTNGATEGEWSGFESGEEKEDYIQKQKERAAIVAAEKETPTGECPNILRQGIFADIAERVGKWSWEVFQGGYGALSAVAHRNMHFFYFSDHVYGMSYSLLVNRTGLGKNLVTNIVRSLLPDGYPVRAGIQSGPALVPLLTSEDLKNSTGRMTLDGRPVLLLASEWSRLIGIAGIQNATVFEDLNDLHMRHWPWSLSRSHKTSSGGDIEIINPALTIVGTTTKKLYLEALTARAVESGTLNRYLTLPGSAVFEPYKGRSYKADGLPGLLDPLIAYAWGLGQEIGDVYAPDAWQAFLEFQESFLLPLLQDAATSEVFSRIHLHLQHVAAIYAWQARSRYIEMPHFEAAKAVVKASHAFLQSMLQEKAKVFEATPMQAAEASMERGVIAKLKREPGLSQREVCRALCNGTTAGYAAWGKVATNLLNGGALFINKKGKKEALYVSPGY